MQSGSKESLNENFWENPFDSESSTEKNDNDKEELEIESVSSLPEVNMFGEDENEETLFFNDLSIQKKEDTINKIEKNMKEEEFKGERNEMISIEKTNEENISIDKSEDVVIEKTEIIDYSDDEELEDEIKEEEIFSEKSYEELEEIFSGESYEELEEEILKEELEEVIRGNESEEEIQNEELDNEIEEEIIKEELEEAIRGNKIEEEIIKEELENEIEEEIILATKKDVKGEEESSKKEVKNLLESLEKNNTDFQEEEENLELAECLKREIDEDIEKAREFDEAIESKDKDLQQKENESSEESKNYIDVEQEIKDLTLTIHKNNTINEDNALEILNDANELPESFFEDDENFFDLLKNKNLNFKEISIEEKDLSVEENSKRKEIPAKDSKIRRSSSSVEEKDYIDTSIPKKIEESSKETKKLPIKNSYKSLKTTQGLKKSEEIFTTLQSTVKEELLDENSNLKNKNQSKAPEIQFHKKHEDDLSLSVPKMDKKETLISLQKNIRTYKPAIKKREVVKTHFKKIQEKEPEVKNINIFRKGIHENYDLKEEKKPKICSKIIFINGRLLEFKPTLQKRYDINKKEEKEKRIYVTNFYRFKINIKHSKYINDNIKEILNSKEKNISTSFNFLLKDNVLTKENKADNETVNEIIKISFSDKELAVKRCVDNNYWSLAFFISGNDNYDRILKYYTEKMIKSEYRGFFFKGKLEGDLLKQYELLKFSYKKEYEWILDEILKKNKDINLQFEILIFFYKFYCVDKFKEYLSSFRFNFGMLEILIENFKELDILPLKKNYYNFLKEFGTKEEVGKFYNQNKKELKEKVTWNLQGWKGFVEKGLMKMVGLDEENEIESNYEEKKEEIKIEDKIIEKIQNIDIKTTVKKEINGNPIEDSNLDNKIYSNKKYSRSYADIFSTEHTKEEFKDDTDIFLSNYNEEKEETKKIEEEKKSIFNIFSFFKGKKEKKVKIEVNETEYVYDKITKKWVDKNKKIETNKPKEKVEKIKKALPTLGERKEKSVIKKDGSLSSRYAIKAKEGDKKVNNLIPVVKKGEK